MSQPTRVTADRMSFCAMTDAAFNAPSVDAEVGVDAACAALDGASAVHS